MPFYNTSSTSAALGIPQKWLDNLLSHNKIDGVEQARQGVQRRLSIEAIAVIAVTYKLVEAAGIPIGAAVVLAGRMIESESHSITIADMITIMVDRDALDKSIQHDIERAIEMTPLPVRGRPVSSA